MSRIIVNEKQSVEIGKIVGQLKFKERFLQRDFLTNKLDKEVKSAMYYYAVGICHQTYHLANSKLQLFGWDFLEYGFLEIAQQKPELLDANFLVKLSVSELIEHIKPFFAEDHIPEKCSLDSLEERAALWLDMAHFLSSNHLNFYEFIKNSKAEPDYFYNKLFKAEAYADPLQKKTSFLMKLLEDAQLIHISDTKNIIPIMDYHMQRVLLRTACVEVTDIPLKQKLQNREAIESDEDIRKACIQSMKTIAETAGFSVLKMNDVFYTMGRSCCNENMLCQSHSCEKTPCTLSLAVEVGKHEKCIFQDVCKGATHEEYRKYWQPQIKTHYY